MFCHLNRFLLAFEESRASPSAMGALDLGAALLGVESALPTTPNKPDVEILDLTFDGDDDGDAFGDANADRNGTRTRKFSPTHTRTSPHTFTDPDFPAQPTPKRQRREKTNFKLSTPSPPRPINTDFVASGDSRNDKRESKTFDFALFRVR